MPPNQSLSQLGALSLNDDGAGSAEDSRIRCAILGCGMMGQEHCSYLMGYPKDARIEFLCDPHAPSIEHCLKVINDFNSSSSDNALSHPPTTLKDEEELLKHVESIDLLVIASPNYLHTDQLLLWGRHPITILCEKPVAVNIAQHDRLQAFASSRDCQARVWTAMEYRFIPAIAKLLNLLPAVGSVKMVSD